MSKNITDSVMIHECASLTSKKGTFYFSGKLSFPNSNGKKVSFKIWDQVGTSSGSKPDPLNTGLYKATGHIEKFNNSDQFIIKKITPLEKSSIELDGFKTIPPFGYDIETLNKEFMWFIDSIESKWLRKLVFLCLVSMEDDWNDWKNLWPDLDMVGSDVARLHLEDNHMHMKYFNMWGAVYYHHAYEHGWLIHTLEVTRVAVGMLDSLLSTYSVNEDLFGSLSDQRDLVVAGSVLHDSGKAYENKKNGLTYSKTRIGRFSENDLDMTAEFVSKVASVNYLDSVNPHMFEHLMKVIRGHHGKDFGNQGPHTFPAQCVQKSDSAAANLAQIRDRILLGEECPVIKKNTHFSYSYDLFKV